jgi:hypothetical protein
LLNALAACSQDSASHQLQGKQRDLYLLEMAKLDELSNQVEAIRATLAKTANELGASTAENEGGWDRQHEEQLLGLVRHVKLHLSL